MKKKYLAMLLAVSMVMCSGCALPFGLDNVSIEEDGNGKDEDAKNKDDKENSGSTDNEGTDANAGTDTGSGDSETEKLVMAGPEYIIAYCDEEIGYYETGAVLQLRADKMILLDDSNTNLAKAVQMVNDYCYDSVMERWDYATYEETYGTEPESIGQMWNDEMRISVSRNDSQMLSMSVTQDTYLGGAHPYDETHSYNFDPATGEELDIKSVVTDYDLLYNCVRDRLELIDAGTPDDADSDEYGVALYPEWENTLKEFFYERKYINWMGLEDGIVIYFNGYDIAPWAAGQVSVKFTLDNNSELLVSDYFHDKSKVKPVEKKEYTYSDVVEEVIKPLSKNLGVWNYDDCIGLVKGTGLEYSCYEPYESDDSGDIRIEDNATGYVMWLAFWPVDIESGVYSKETDALSRINYSNDEYNFMIDNFYNERETSYNAIDYETHIAWKFDTAKDYWTYFGYYFN